MKQFEAKRKSDQFKVVLPPDDRVMKLPEVADYLQCKQITIYKWAKSGYIPAFKVGSQWRFKKAAIDAWILENTNGKS